MVAPLVFAAGKFALMQMLKHSFMTATAAHMATGGKSTDLLLDGGAAAANAIGPENSKKIGEFALNLGQKVSTAWGEMLGKAFGRATGISSSRDNNITQNMTHQGNQSPEHQSTEQGSGQNRPLSDRFSLTALGEGAGGMGLILGGLKMRSPMMMLMGIFLSLLMVGQLFGKDDEKKAAPAAAPAPNPAAP